MFPSAPARRAYPPIPVLAALGPDDTLDSYAARALTHAMHHGTATLSDEAIAQAIRVAVIAVAAPGIEATGSDRINATVHQLRAAQRHRAALAADERARVSAALAGSDSGSDSGGQRTEAPRTPPPSFTPPAATVRRPAPVALADDDF